MRLHPLPTVCTFHGRRRSGKPTAEIASPSLRHVSSPAPTVGHLLSCLRCRGGLVNQRAPRLRCRSRYAIHRVGVTVGPLLKSRPAPSSRPRHEDIITSNARRQNVLPGLWARSKGTAPANRHPSPSAALASHAGAEANHRPRRPSPGGQTRSYAGLRPRWPACDFSRRVTGEGRRGLAGERFHFGPAVRVSAATNPEHRI